MEPIRNRSGPEGQAEIVIVQERLFFETLSPQDSGESMTEEESAFVTCLLRKLEELEAPFLRGSADGSMIGHLKDLITAFHSFNTGNYARARRRYYAMRSDNTGSAKQAYEETEAKTRAEAERLAGAALLSNAGTGVFVAVGEFGAAAASSSGVVAVGPWGASAASNGAVASVTQESAATNGPAGQSVQVRSDTEKPNGIEPGQAESVYYTL